MASYLDAPKTVGTPLQADGRSIKSAGGDVIAVANDTWTAEAIVQLANFGAPVATRAITEREQFDMQRFRNRMFGRPSAPAGVTLAVSFRRGFDVGRRSPVNPVVDNAVWTDLITTYARFPHAFEHGCGRETMVYWVNYATGRRHGANHIRRVLLAAVAQGRAEIKLRRTRHECTRFALLSFLPLEPFA